MRDWTEGQNAQDLSRAWDFARSVLSTTLPEQSGHLDRLANRDLGSEYDPGQLATLNR